MWKDISKHVETLLNFNIKNVSLLAGTKEVLLWALGNILKIANIYWMLFIGEHCAQ